MKSNWRHSLLIAGLLCTLCGCASYGEKVTVGDGDIYYKDGATKEDAQKVGDAMAKQGFLDKSKTETAKSVRVLKPGGKNILEIVVKDELINDEGTANLLRVGVASDVAIEAFGGAATELHLCDSKMAMKKSAEVEYVQRASFGKELDLKLTRDYSADETKKFADYLAANAGGAKPGLVIWAKKDGAAYLISLVVSKAVLEAKDSNQTYTAFANEISSKVFKGAKVKVDLCDDHEMPQAHAESK